LLEAAVMVHPGEFYGLADERLVVVSLLTRPDVLAAAVERIRLIFHMTNAGSYLLS
jgi:hypothetical protein